jgi:hypothetical protein
MGSSSEVAWTNGGPPASRPLKGVAEIGAEWTLPSLDGATPDASRFASCTDPTFKAPIQEPIDQQMSMDLTRMAKEDT